MEVDQETKQTTLMTEEIQKTGNQVLALEILFSVSSEDDADEQIQAALADVLGEEDCVFDPQIVKDISTIVGVPSEKIRVLLHDTGVRFRHATAQAVSLLSGSPRPGAVDANDGKPFSATVDRLMRSLPAAWVTHCSLEVPLPQSDEDPPGRDVQIERIRQRVKNLAEEGTDIACPHTSTALDVQVRCVGSLTPLPGSRVDSNSSKVAGEDLSVKEKEKESFRSTASPEVVCVGEGGVESGLEVGDDYRVGVVNNKNGPGGERGLVRRSASSSGEPRTLSNPEDGTPPLPLQERQSESALLLPSAPGRGGAHLPVVREETETEEGHSCQWQEGEGEGEEGESAGPHLTDLLADLQNLEKCVSSIDQVKGGGRPEKGGGEEQEVLDTRLLDQPGGSIETQTKTDAGKEEDLKGQKNKGDGDEVLSKKPFEEKSAEDTFFVPSVVLPPSMIPQAVLWDHEGSFCQAVDHVIGEMDAVTSRLRTLEASRKTSSQQNRLVSTPHVLHQALENIVAGLPKFEEEHKRGHTAGPPSHNRNNTFSAPLPPTHASVHPDRVPGPSAHAPMPSMPFRQPSSSTRFLSPAEAGLTTKTALKGEPPQAQAELQPLKPGASTGPPEPRGIDPEAYAAAVADYVWQPVPKPSASNEKPAESPTPPALAMPTRSSQVSRTPPQPLRVKPKLSGGAPSHSFLVQRPRPSVEESIRWGRAHTNEWDRSSSKWHPPQQPFETMQTGGASAASRRESEPEASPSTGLAAVERRRPAPTPSKISWTTWQAAPPFEADAQEVRQPAEPLQ
uniref:Uncharacterized protein n=1 Tax=Chromera velia CCMP2878 TaxID=1169474 RepID=A0A0G4HNQ2_9ALVE|eukprot:Cvel_29492.t1-p1 / transcript=Cvel_29492.t1 / gene=Cvel_29492 / organism=Chromera_velia_CCMP2878 / gene_product=Extensin, putative / transcript_product=Extensin, putative / location=Cvel_scaffold4049:4306-8491(-) / protein_length=789 / sequence_SO=supercontig / SO=protein_coding / is_pseudo=false